MKKALQRSKRFYADLFMINVLVFGLFTVFGEWMFVQNSFQLIGLNVG